MFMPRKFDLYKVLLELDWFGAGYGSGLCLWAEEVRFEEKMFNFVRLAMIINNSDGSCVDPCIKDEDGVFYWAKRKHFG